MPKSIAIRVAMDSFESFLKDNDINISLVIYDSTTFELSQKLYSAIEKYIGENYVDEYQPYGNRRYRIKQTDIYLDSLQTVAYSESRISYSQLNLSDWIGNIDGLISFG
jgi:hypothetical protein